MGASIWMSIIMYNFVNSQLSVAKLVQGKNNCIFKK